MLTTALFEQNEGRFDTIQVNVRFTNQDNTELEFQMPKTRKWRKAQYMQCQNGMSTFAEKDYTISQRPITINLPGKWGDVVYPHGIVIFMKENSEGATDNEVADAWQACLSATTVDEIDATTMYDNATDDDIESEQATDDVIHKESDSSEYEDDSEIEYDSTVSDTPDDENWPTDVGPT